MCVCVCVRARASICLSFCLSVSVCVFACRWLHVHVSAYQCSPFLTPDSAIISPNIAHLGCRFSVEAHHSLTNARNPAFYSAPDIACDSSAHGVRSSKLRLYLTAWNRLHPARVETIQNAGLHGTCTVVKLNLRNAHGWGQGVNMLCGCVRTTTSTRPSPVSAKAFLTAGLLSYALIVVICPENSRRPPKFLKLRAGSTILTGCDGILDTSSPASSQRSAVGIDMARRGTEAPPRARAAAGRTTLRSISVRYVLPRRAARLKGREAQKERTTEVMGMGEVSLEVDPRSG